MQHSEYLLHGKELHLDAISCQYESARAAAAKLAADPHSPEADRHLFFASPRLRVSTAQFSSVNFAVATFLFLFAFASSSASFSLRLAPPFHLRRELIKFLRLVEEIAMLRNRPLENCLGAVQLRPQFRMCLIPIPSISLMKSRKNGGRRVSRASKP